MWRTHGWFYKFTFRFWASKMHPRMPCSKREQDKRWNERKSDKIKKKTLVWHLWRHVRNILVLRMLTGSRCRREQPFSCCDAWFPSEDFMRCQNSSVDRQAARSRFCVLLIAWIGCDDELCSEDSSDYEDAEMRGGESFYPDSTLRFPQGLATACKQEESRRSSWRLKRGSVPAGAEPGEHCELEAVPAAGVICKRRNETSCAPSSLACPTRANQLN